MMTDEAFIRRITISGVERKEEVQPILKDALTHDWGDYIFVTINAEGCIYEGELGELTDVFFIVYERTNEGWEILYSGTEYPEAVSEVI